MNNDSPIVDEELRRQALDPEASFIVQAPAGSGKTELLIQHYLTLLAQAEAPEEIIAITFTRKAAGEMRNRVLQALEQAAIAGEPETDPARLTWRLGQAVLRQDRLKNWQLQDCPARLRILTIDALCAALSRQLSLASGLGAAPSIIEDATTLYREAARQTLAMLEEPCNRGPIQLYDTLRNTGAPSGQHGGRHKEDSEQCVRTYPKGFDDLLNRHKHRPECPLARDYQSYSSAAKVDG